MNSSVENLEEDPVGDEKESILFQNMQRREERTVVVGSINPKLNYWDKGLGSVQN